MAARVLKIDRSATQADALGQAARVLADGGLVVFPTETVYGVAANAANEAAVARLREVKGRAAVQPFTVHVGKPGDAAAYLDQPTAAGRRLMAKGWPGPLTLLFAVARPEATEIHARLSTAGREAVFRAGVVGLRCPDDSVASDLLSRAGVPVIASSANRAGRPPPLDADAAGAELREAVDLIVDGGRSRYGAASTIVSVEHDRVSLVREGVLDERTVRRLAGLNVLFVCSGNTCRSPIAEGLCRKLMAERLSCPLEELASRGVSVSSCGTSAVPGASATSEAIAACRGVGVDLSTHRSRRLTLDAVRTADHVFVMTRQHLAAVTDLAPFAAERTALLDGDGDIEDPIGATAAAYAACAQRIEAALRRRLKDIEL